MTRTIKEAAARLAEALHRENAALASLDLTRATALLAEKTAAADHLMDAVGSAEAPAMDARATILAAHRLRELADENRRLLERAIQVQSRVVGTVRKAAIRPRANQGYRRGGQPENAQTAPLSMRADV
jgi:hypothetical protein